MTTTKDFDNHLHATVTEELRERVITLLALRPDLRLHADFGKQIGRSPSWVSAFLAGRRPATDIDLVVRMARALGVSVNYLVGDDAHQPTPAQLALLAVSNRLTEEAVRTLLVVGMAFANGATESTAALPREPHHVPARRAGRRRPAAASD